VTSSQFGSAATSTTRHGFVTLLMTMTVQELVSLLCEKDKRRKEKEARGEFAYIFNSSKCFQKGKKPCSICQQTNHVTVDYHHKGKPKCKICGKFGHHLQDRWRNLLNKGKGRVMKNKRDTQGASSSKGLKE